MTTPTREEVGNWKYIADKYNEYPDYTQLDDLFVAYLAQAEELEAARKEAQKWRRIRKPTHGTCCTCQRCGLDHDTCRCDLDEVCDELEQYKAFMTASNERELTLMNRIEELERGDVQ